MIFRSLLFPGLLARRPISTSINLGNLKPAVGSHKKAKRRGRGIGAHGHLCGRGANGQKSRSGGTPGPRFTGGQTPFYISVPKKGHVNPNTKEYAEINLERVQHLINTGRLDATRPITLKSFFDAGVNGIKDGVKVLAGGHHHFSTPIEIHATRFTKTAIRAIEEAGGKSVAVYHSEDGLRQLKDPERFWRKNPEKALMPLEAPVRLKERLFYSRPENRGYLAPEVSSDLTAEFRQRYQTYNVDK